MLLLHCMKFMPQALPDPDVRVQRLVDFMQMLLKVLHFVICVDTDWFSFLFANIADHMFNGAFVSDVSCDAATKTV
jgi:hypothetical protein